MRRRILVVGHEASHSGAPLVLLDFLRWLKEQRPLEFDLAMIFARGGPLLEAFSRLGPVHVLNRIDPQAGALHKFFSDRLVDRRMFLRARLGRVARSLRPGPTDLILGNTAIVGWMMCEPALAGTPSLVHVHERKASIERFSTTADFNALVSRARRFVAVSESVREDLIHLSPALRGRVEVVRNWLVRRVEVEASPSECRRALAMELGVSMDAWIVGAVGHLDPIKGPDLFIGMASRLAHLLGRDKVVFAWLGSGERSAYADSLRRKAHEVGLEGRYFLLGARPEPDRFLAACDVVTVCSRSEGSSLVVLEASHVGVPVAVFAGSGGPVEFAARGAAGIAPGFDVSAMADLLAAWCVAPESAKAMVEVARKKLASDHNREQQCRRLLEQLLNLDRP